VNNIATLDIKRYYLLHKECRVYSDCAIIIIIIIIIIAVIVGTILNISADIYTLFL
jgi:hypothetical protein